MSWGRTNKQIEDDGFRDGMILGVVVTALVSFFVGVLLYAWLVC